MISTQDDGQRRRPTNSGHTGRRTHRHLKQPCESRTDHWTEEKANRRNDRLTTAMDVTVYNGRKNGKYTDNPLDLQHALQEKEGCSE